MKREEKVPFLKAVLFMAKVDRDTDITELSYYQRLCIDLGLGSEEFSNIQTAVLSGKESLEEYLDQIQERSTKLQLLYQMMTMVCTDGKIDNAEFERIMEVSEYMKVEGEKVREIAELVKDGEALKEKRERILEMNV